MGIQSHSLQSFAEPLQLFGSPGIGHPVSPPSVPPTSHIENIPRERRKKRMKARGQGKSYRHDTTICTLPDNVLLEIFDFCQKNHDTLRLVWKWHLLVHICRRWRQIIFASPQRLNLQILCTHRTPVRKSLGIWPVFPIVVDFRYSGSSITPNDEDNVIAALEQSDRVCYVRLAVTGSQLEKMATVMQEPFPVLTRLDIFSEDGKAPVLPAKFLGGSAPCLQVIYLRGIPFPTLPTLLLSTGDLVELELRRIPPTGYISPAAMVAALAALPRLKLFIIKFQSATSRPDRMRPPPVTRTVLPALSYFEFNGASEYLEDLAARIDGPRLNLVFIHYLNQLVDFQVVQLSKFVDRSVGPKLTPFKHAHISFFSDKVSFDTYRRANHPWDWHPVRITISCEGIHWQVSHMAQVLSHFSATLSNVAHLKLEVQPAGRQSENADEVEWSHLLHQFSNVQTLHVSRELSEHVALALEDITAEMVAEVLPSLDLIRMVGQPASSVDKFVAGRRLSGRPVTVIDTETEFDERLECYVSEQ